MRIVIESIPHKNQRYPTVGDWFWENPSTTDATIQIKVSQLSDWRREALIAVHELVEILLCTNDVVSEEAVDKFDKAFEANRHPDNTDEPGDDPKAPYVKQHCIATGIERILAANLGVNWKEYEEEINAL